MKKSNLIFLWLLFIFNISCNDELQDFTNESNLPKSTQQINESGKVNGIQYSIKNATLNQNIIILGTEDINLTSNDSQLEQGIFNLEILDPIISEKITDGKVLYLTTEGYTYLKTITNVSQTGTNSVSLTTKEANLGDIFSSGSLELNIDAQEVEKIATNNYPPYQSYNIPKVDKTFSYLFEYSKEHNIGNVRFNPNFSFKTSVNLKIGFGSSPVPNELVTIFEIQTSIGPHLFISQPINKNIDFDLVKIIPSAILATIKNFPVTIPIPVGPIPIPVTITLGEVNLPVNLNANLSDVTNFEYNLAGNIKIGYAYYNNVPGKNSHFIYENTLNANKYNYNINGDLSTDFKFTLIPKISVINSNIINIGAGLSLGVKTLSMGNKSSQTPIKGGSIGIFNSSANFHVKSLGLTLVNKEFLKLEKELWKIGSFNKSVSFSDIKYTKPSIIYCSLFSYNYNFTLNYKYPITGQKIKGNIKMSYDIYDDKGKVVKNNLTATITPSNITETSFDFNLCIPFKQDLTAWRTGFLRPVSYLKNINITDEYGNIINGILNSKTAKLEDSIEIASPLNKSYWK